MLCLLDASLFRKWVWVLIKALRSPADADPLHPLTPSIPWSLCPQHHCFPKLSMLSYQKAMPRVKALCAKHGIPYVQESIWVRLKKTVDTMVGASDMRTLPLEWEAALNE